MLATSKHRFGMVLRVVVPVAFFAAPALADNFVLHVDHVPPVAGTYCDDYAVSEGQRLKAFVGSRFGSFDIVDARCNQQDHPTELEYWNLKITYSAAQKLPVVSTYADSVLDQPGFKTKSACDAALPAERVAFKTKTTLDVFSSYCFVPEFTDMRWSTAITGFGDTAVRPYTANATIFSNMESNTWVLFQQTLAGNLGKIGLSMYDFNVSNNTGYFTATFRYYGDHQIRPEPFTIARFDDPKDCKNAVQNTNVALQQAKTINYIAHCQDSGILGPGADLVTFGERQSPPKLINSGRSYTTFAVCMNELPQVLDHYRQNLHRDMTAGYCTHDGDTRTFKIIMIEARTNVRAEFDGGRHYKLARGTIRNGEVYTDSRSSSDATVRIKSMMSLVEGQFKNEEDTFIRLPTVSVNIDSIRRAGSDGFKVTFTSNFDIAIPANMTTTSLEAIVSRNVSSSGQDAFSTKYEPTCSGHDVFWYYLEPHMSGCVLGQDPLPDDAAKLTIELSPSDENTTGKSPEYAKLWADNKLEVTFIRGNMVNFTGNDDLINNLRSKYGDPTVTDTRGEDQWHLSNATFTTPRGELVVHEFYFENGNMAGAPQSFLSAFTAVAADSDVVGYNGHAGLGNNVRGFLNAATFKPDRYYLYWINACQPYVYLNDTIFNAASRANHGRPWSENLDLMALVNIVTFSGGYDMSAIITDLVGQTKTYAQILDHFYGAAVIGEEDNP